jgi:hypothetical protein
MKVLLTPLMYAAACGLILSISEHVSALVDLPSPLGEFSKYLFFGLFVVWLPTVLVATRLSKDFKQRDFWKAVLRGCPKWMKWMVYFFFGYAILNFVLCAIIDSTAKGTPIDARIGSGHSMAFYSAAMAALYSAINIKERDKTRRCFNGHPVSPSASFCEQCGARVMEPKDPK